MADYRALIANCVVGGELFTYDGGRRVRNLIRLRLDELDIEILQRPDIIRGTFQEFQHRTIYTTDLAIRNLLPESFDRAQLVARDISELLSLATSSDVAVFGYEYPDVSPIAACHAIIGQVQHFLPLLPIRRGEVIRSFLEQAWPTFRRLRNTRQLNIAFDYYTMSEKEKPIEIKLIATFVLFENLKHTYALEKGYPYVKGYFRDCGATRTKPGPRKTFEGLLDEMLTSVGMNVEMSKVVHLRNELIHSGIANLNLDDKLRMYKDCQDILREYFLRVLNYRGEYQRYSGDSVIA